MGLDTSHDAWHGAYSAFTRWRNTVAAAAGYAVWDVMYEDGYQSPTVMIDWGHITERNLQGHWDETPSDPLIVLIAHSDCDGVIRPEQAKPLADRLEGLLARLNDEGGGHLERMGGHRGATEQFIAGLRAAVEAGEDVDFH
jgi:hypothetical protein